MIICIMQITDLTYCRIALPLIISFPLLRKVKIGSWSVVRRRMVTPTRNLTNCDQNDIDIKVHACCNVT